MKTSYTRSVIRGSEIRGANTRSQIRCFSKSYHSYYPSKTHYYDLVFAPFISYLQPRISGPLIYDLVFQNLVFATSYYPSKRHYLGFQKPRIRGRKYEVLEYEVANTRSQIRGHKYEVFQFRTTRITPQKGIITTSYLCKYDRICANTRSAEPRIGGFFANTTLYFGKGPY